MHIIVGLDQGGGQSALFRLATDRSRSTEHIVVSMMDLGVYGVRLVAAGVAVYTLGMRQGSLTLRGAAALWKLVRRLRPDVVQTWMYHADVVGGGIARLAGCQCIVWGVVNFNLAPELISRRTRAVVRLAAALSHVVPRRIVSCSTTAIPVHQNFGFAKRKFRSVHLGFDNSAVGTQADGARFREAHGMKADEKVIGCVARWDLQKDHGSLLAALATVARSHVFRSVLVGPGITAQNAALVEHIRVAGIGDRVILAGQIASIAEVMAGIDLHVLASLGEGFPNVLCEAMLNGVPCVATDVGDVSLILGDTGWVVPAGDPATMALAVSAGLDAMDNRQRWEERRQACRSRIVDLFSMERMVAGYHDVWNDARSAPNR